MLNSAEHGISNAHEYKNIKNNAFLGSDKTEVLFFMLINVKIPIIVGIYTFMSRIIFMLSRVGMNLFYNFGPWLSVISVGWLLGWLYWA